MTNGEYEMRPDHSEDEKTDRREPDLPPPGYVRPLTDPEAVARWRVLNEPPKVLTEWNPFSPERMSY